MNEFLVALGTICFAISGAYSVFVEYFRPSEMEIARKLLATDPTDAYQQARTRKNRERAGFFVIWLVGMALSAAGFFTGN